MKKLTLLAILSLLVFNFTYGQDREKYSELIKEVWGFYGSKDFLKSGKKYQKLLSLLAVKGWSMTDIT